MFLTITCDSETEKTLCKLLIQSLEDKWVAENEPPKPLFDGTRIYVDKSQISQIVIC